MASSKENSGFQCMECGKRFRSVAAAERATRNGCPGCGGSDIDIALPEPKKIKRTSIPVLNRTVTGIPIPPNGYSEEYDRRFAQAMNDAQDEDLTSLEAADEILRRLLGGEIVTVY